jgi:hypothetical protein
MFQNVCSPSCSIYEVTYFISIFVISEMPPSTYNEINGIIQKLRNNKAPGPDNIISELIKEGGQQLKHRIFILILKIWEKEVIPTDWKDSIIRPIYKKGDRMQCKNY